MGYRVLLSGLSHDFDEFESASEQCSLVFNVNIFSHGSAVTHLRCGEVLLDCHSANFRVSISLKEFWKLANIWRSYEENLMVYFFDSEAYAYLLLSAFTLLCHLMHNSLQHLWSSLHTTRSSHHIMSKVSVPVCSQWPARRTLVGVPDRTW